MKTVLKARTMKEWDSYTICDVEIPSPVLMERAALAVADEVCRILGNKKGRVYVLCGPGNNGGDGYACARILHMRGVSSYIIFTGKREHMTEETRRQAGICSRLGVPVLENDDGAAIMRSQSLTDMDVIVDAIFGIGLSRTVTGGTAQLIKAVNVSPAAVAAIDIPSGINADTGQIMGTAVRADVTVTMQCIKPGLILYPGAACAGRTVTADLGITGPGNAETEMKLIEKSDLADLLPLRDPSGNKGTFGKLLVIAGSEGMAGAAVMCAEAAVRSGCGMVKVMTPYENRDILMRILPEVMLAPWKDSDEAETVLHDALLWCDAVVCGPGMGMSPVTEKIVSELLSDFTGKTVLDADGLNILKGDIEKLKDSGADIVVTPHVGEMSRLSGTPVPEIKADAVSAALSFSGESGTVCVLKDARTVTAVPDGRVFFSVSGNCGMGTAGSGDVLAGIMGSLMAQGMDPAEAAAAAVTLHGAAGDEAAAARGMRAMTARDITAGLENVFEALFPEERGGYM
ncbi:MAG: NAD(P)H-hydrate dehydratase [Lachnospiraceae bacterium]|nr:NAD(P)H-hydrate dehydratase [Lachnospiraceae bacterium]